MTKRILCALMVWTAAWSLASAQTAGNADSQRTVPNEEVAKLLADAAKLPPEQAVVLTPPMWGLAVHGGLNTLKADMDFKDGHPRFMIHELGRGRVFAGSLGSALDLRKYPNLVVVYRGKNLRGTPPYGLAFNEGADTFGLWALSATQFIGDGQVHEIRKDLRNQPVSRVGVETDLMVAPYSPTGEFGKANEGLLPAELELLNLRVEADPAKPLAEVQREDPATLTVVGEDEKPLADAMVTIDGERANWAVSGKTDAQGKVTLAPLKIDSFGHTLLITKDGYAREWLKRSAALTASFTLRKADQSVGGQVVKPDGKPMADAEVRAYGAGFGSARTDAQGKFTIKNLPAGALKLAVEMHVYQEEDSTYYDADGSASAQAGDKDVKIALVERPYDQRSNAANPQSRTRMLPALEAAGLGPQLEQAKGKAVVVVFWDPEQRVARHTVQVLATKVDDWAKKNVVILTVLTSPERESDAMDFMKKNEIRLPVGILPSDKQALLKEWGVAGNPWIILTDTAHSVRGDGLSPEQLDEMVTGVKASNP